MSCATTSLRDFFRVLLKNNPLHHNSIICLDAENRNIKKINNVTKKYQTVRKFDKLLDESKFYIPVALSRLYTPSVYSALQEARSSAAVGVGAAARRAKRIEDAGIR